MFLIFIAKMPSIASMPFIIKQSSGSFGDTTTTASAAAAESQPTREVKRTETGSMSRKRKRDEAARAPRPKLLFDRLAEEELRNVVRNWSQAPSDVKWGNFVPQDVVMTLLRKGGRIAAALISNWSFSRLRYTRRDAREAERLLTQIVADIGPTMLTVSIEGKISSTMARAIAYNCSNLRFLSL